jgi:uncharacterized heparinase superfamily protein
LRQPVAEWVQPASTSCSLRNRNEFEFLGVRRCVRFAKDWNDSSCPALWLYHLHYFDDLNAEGYLERREWHRELVERWIVENPPTLGVGWDPFPTSLRVINWIKWHLAGEHLPRNALQSLRVQLSRVASRLEYHLMGNHLLENARALVFGGCFFADREADGWLQRGLEIFAIQLPEQILADGGHFERSPMYHQIVLAGLLDLYNLIRVYGRPQCIDIEGAISRMLRWSWLMRHPDGEIALFNDSAMRQGPPPCGVDAYAARLGIESAHLGHDPPATVHLPQSGYARVSRDGYVAIMNIGSVAPDYQPGHAHADTLSFELSYAGERLIVDTGTSTYESGNARSRERGSAAHNSVVIDGENSSEVWGAFRVARRARAFGVAISTEGGASIVAASHDGYQRLRVGATHQRRWEYGADYLRIDDLIVGAGEADLELILNIHPDFAVSRLSGGGFVVGKDSAAFQVHIDTSPELAAEIRDFLFAPQFGKVVAGARLVASGRFSLPKRLITVIRFVPVGN